MSSSLPRYRLRRATEADLAGLLAYYNAHLHENVLVRTEESYKRALDDKSVLLIEGPDGKICAASISWKQAGGEYVEFGSTRATTPHRGLPIYETFFSLQGLLTFFEMPPKDRVVVEVDVTNPKVYRRLFGNPLNMCSWKPTEALMKTKKSTILANDRDDSLYFQCGVEALPHHATYIRYLQQNPVLTAKDGTRIALEFDVDLLRDRAADIERLAKMDLGDVEDIDEAKTWRATRDALFGAPVAVPPRPDAGSKGSPSAPQP